jgi:hypothetical protein
MSRPCNMPKAWTADDSAWLRENWGAASTAELTTRGFDGDTIAHHAARLGLIKPPPVTRPEVGRYPMLQDQRRTSTGYTHAKGGVLRMPPPGASPRTETPVLRDVSVSPKPKKTRKRALVDA